MPPAKPYDMDFVLSLRLSGLTITEWLETDAGMHQEFVQKRNAYDSGVQEVIRKARDDQAVAAKHKEMAAQVAG